MAEREVRYATTKDGVSIAYCVEGEGPALLVAARCWSNRFHWIRSTASSSRSRLGAGRSLIRYDMRGTGLSQRDVPHVPSTRCSLTCEQLFGLSGSRFSSWHCSGLTAIKYAAETAGSDALILYGAYAWPLDFLTRESMDASRHGRLAEVDWQVAARTFADLGDAPPENGLGVGSVG